VKACLQYNILYAVNRGHATPRSGVAGMRAISASVLHNWHLNDAASANTIRYEMLF